jgi:sugar/nucleoside kinase (ribokinase family)
MNGSDTQPSEAPLEAGRRTRILHMTPHDTAACIAMASAAREAGVIVSLDADNVFTDTNKLLPLVDILAATTGFVEKFTRTNDTRQGLSKIIKRFGCKVAAVTIGGKGSLICCGDSFIETPAFDVPGGCRDTTGAGDAFRAGLLSVCSPARAWKQPLKLQTLLRLSNVAGTAPGQDFR